MVISAILRVLAHVLGTGLHLFLIILLIAKRRATVADRIALAAILCSGIWHFTVGAMLYQGFAFEQPDPALAGSLESSALLALLLAPAFLLHLILVWTRLPPIWGIAVYAGTALAWLKPHMATAYIGVALAASIAVSVRTARRQAHPAFRSFHICLAVSLAAVAIAGLGGRDSAVFAFVSLLPTGCLAWFIYRYNVLGILIGRRAVLVITLAVVSAVYLLFVRWVGDYTALREGVFAGLIELTAIFAAAIVWLPLFEWITRRVSRRAEQYLEFTKEIIERADGILELPDRVQFLADQTARLFGFHRVLLITLEPRVYGSHGWEFPADAGPALEKLEGHLRDHRAELHVRRTRSTEARSLLERWKFTYVYPLWMKEQLIGSLWIDTAPRLYLDEQEPIVLNLSRELSQSIETCRLVEEKIRLEKALLRQEHLASLGKIAATIAHEVKNPLSSIKALSQLMGEDDYVAEKYSRDIGFIVGETDRLASGVEQLLTFSRPTAEPKAEAAIYDLLETTVDTLARQYAGQQIRILQSFDESLRGYLVDRQITQQIVLNLMLNAIQACGTGGTVRLSAAPDLAGAVAIEVVDDGPGIPAGMKDQIFEPFFTTRKQGTGLGLAIVKKNLDQLGGTIRVQSPAMNGRGSAFHVTIPATLRSSVQV
jgi:signal transduction histidine kinase